MFLRSAIKQTVPIRSGDCGRDGEKASSQLWQIKNSAGKPCVHKPRTLTTANVSEIIQKEKESRRDMCIC